MGDILNMFVTQNGVHSFETCRYVIPSVIFSCFFKNLNYSLAIVLQIILNCQEPSKSRLSFGRRILALLNTTNFYHLIANWQTQECFKETSRFVNIVFTDPFCTLHS